ncbi:MAG: polysaccharide deacetylase family protein [Candidatus Krumholzibacteriota bacterium]|nr:polysaccharide deacetylase family protein [Candidatus Krumholzibacteriota bacterium]
MNLQHTIKMRARRGVKRIVKSGAALLSNLVPPPPSGPQKIIILMYHRINSFRHNELSVKTDTFRKQLEWLRENRFRNMRISELEALEGTANLGDRRVIFSFDDGYEDTFLNALPLLREYGYSGIFYIPPGFIGTDRMAPRDWLETKSHEKNRRLSWEQVEALLEAGMEIGSHSLNHWKLTDLPAERARGEIFQSRKRLEEKLGVKITSFCYPGGYYDQSHVAMVRRAGYLSACTASPGRLDLDRLLTLPRLAVQSSDSFYIFRKKLEGRMEFFKIIR